MFHFHKIELPELAEALKAQVGCSVIAYHVKCQSEKLPWICSEQERIISFRIDSIRYTQPFLSKENIEKNI